LAEAPPDVWEEGPGVLTGARPLKAVAVAREEVSASAVLSEVRPLKAVAAAKVGVPAAGGAESAALTVA